jgi:hypothetical protein
MSSCWTYTASTPHGDLVLDVPHSSAPDRDQPADRGAAPRRTAAAARSGPAHAALALERCEPLLQALESWLGIPLDPAPRSLPADDPPGAAARVRDAGFAPGGTRCQLPWPLLCAAAPPTPPVGQGLQWLDLPMLAEFARLPLEALDPARLRAGTLLLLPASFESPWMVRLSDAANTVGLDCRWQLHGAPRLEPREPVSAQRPVPSAPAWRVVSRNPLLLDAEVALGWRQGPFETGPQGRLPPPGKLGPPCPAVLLEPGQARPRAEGVIVAAAQGAALWIRRCRDDSAADTAEDPESAQAAAQHSTQEPSWT